MDTFYKGIIDFHNTWADVVSNGLAYAFIIGLVYVWRTTRKEVNKNVR